MLVPLLRVLWCFWVMFSSGASAFQPGLEQMSCVFSGAVPFQPGHQQMSRNELCMFSSGASACSLLVLPPFQPGLEQVSYTCSLFGTPGREQITDISKWKMGPVADVSCVSSGASGSCSLLVLPPFNQDISK